MTVRVWTDADTTYWDIAIDVKYIIKNYYSWNYCSNDGSITASWNYTGGDSDSPNRALVINRIDNLPAGYGLFFMHKLNPVAQTFDCTAQVQATTINETTTMQMFQDYGALMIKPISS
jgi:hypothetical protein